MDALDNLNWKVTLSVRPKGGIAEKTERFGIESELGLQFGEEQTDINYFIKKREEMQRDLIIFINESKALEANGIYRIRAVAKPNFLLTEIAKELLRIPSVVLSSFMVSRGEYNMELIFHDSEIAAVSNTLIKKLESKTGGSASKVGIKYMGPSGGYRNCIREISKRTELSLVVTEANPPEEELIQERNPVGNEWIRMEKTPSGNGKIYGIYFTTREISHKTVQKIGNGIYFAQTPNPLMEYVDSLIASKRIPAIGRVDLLTGNRFNILTAVPKIFTNEYIDILRKTNLSFPEWNLKIVRVQTIGDWIYTEKLVPDSGAL